MAVCLSLAKDNYRDIIDEGPVDALNVATVEGLRAKVATAVSFLLLMELYPGLLADMVNSAEGAATIMDGVKDEVGFLHHLATQISDEIGPDDNTLPLLQNVSISHPDPYARYMYTAVRFLEKYLDRCREEVTMRGDIGQNFDKAVRVYGSVCAMQTAMLCFAHMDAYEPVLAAVELNVEDIRQRFEKDLKFVDEKKALLRPFIPGGLVI